jgi:hypothetical protein
MPSEDLRFAIMDNPNNKENYISLLINLENAPFIFNFMLNAATHNMLVLMENDYNITKVIDSNQHIVLKHGSEFREVSSLRNLPMHHPRWPKLHALLTSGSFWPLKTISDADRQAKNAELIVRGNHKSAIRNHKILMETLRKEVSQGWMVPIPTAFIEKIRNAEVAPWALLNNGRLKRMGRDLPNSG